MGKQLVEDTLSLSIAWFQRNNYLTDTIRQGAGRWSQGGGESGQVRWVAGADGVELHYETRWGSGPPVAQRYLVAGGGRGGCAAAATGRSATCICRWARRRWRAGIVIAWPTGDRWIGTT